MNRPILTLHRDTALGVPADVASHERAQAILAATGAPTGNAVYSQPVETRILVQIKRPLDTSPYTFIADHIHANGTRIGTVSIKFPPSALLPQRGEVVEVGGMFRTKFVADKPPYAMLTVYRWSPRG